jgi:hypothetical protein
MRESKRGAKEKGVGSLRRGEEERRRGCQGEGGRRNLHRLGFVSGFFFLLRDRFFFSPALLNKTFQYP